MHAHVLSPLGKDENLFHAAISFSGTMLMGGDMMTTRDNNAEYYEQFCGQITEENIAANHCNMAYRDLVMEAMEDWVNASPGHLFPRYIYTGHRGQRASLDTLIVGIYLSFLSLGYCSLPG